MWNTQTVWFDVAIVMSIFAIGNILFGHFEEHKPKLRRLLKVVIVAGLVILLSSAGLRWVAYTLVGIMGLVALYLHTVWLPRHGINGWTGEPKDKYYALIGARPKARAAAGPAETAGPRPASRTAYRVALRRAAHQLLDVPPVLDDPIAIPILGDETAAALQKDPSTFERGPLDEYMRAFMAARSRFAEDHLDAARDRGVGQYVILGAGLDTFAYRQRRADPPLRVWEIDQPATQAWKRERLAAAGIAIPDNVTYVPVDFERDRLPDALTRAGFDPSAPTVFAWLGVTPYLTADAIDATLDYVAAVAGPHGGVAFDYGLERSLLTVAQKVVFDRLAARVAAAGEPWITLFEPAALATRLRALGFTTIEDVGADALNERYFAGRTDGLRVGGMGRIMWAGCS